MLNYLLIIIVIQIDKVCILCSTKNNHIFLNKIIKDSDNEIDQKSPESESESSEETQGGLVGLIASLSGVSSVV